MRGIILAGGTGQRLRPLTNITNKHILPVYNKPMIYYPLEKLIQAGIKEILIVSGKEHAGDFLRLLGSGKEWGAKFTYEIQDEAGGIAQALSLAEDFTDNERIAVILGDNIIEDDLSSEIKEFENGKFNAKIFLKEVEDPERFGVAELDGDKVIGIEEKPKKPKSNYAVVGLYLYTAEVFDVIKKLKPSARGEYEITDVNNHFIRKGKMGAGFIKGYWTDAGTFDSLLRASQMVKESGKD
ncbi:MAG: sugar phosphate nucleotidyltransferase [Candidatus Diapherotrites archaeon]